jgi:Fe-S oxidoreductase
MISHRLPLLAEREDELSKCAYCPKLCRATCVVSEALPREALTPWGKMTNAFDAARTGELSPERAELAWACSNCFRCREACDHRNPVTETLNDARADYVALGQAPTAVTALLARQGELRAEHTAAIAELSSTTPGVRADASRTLLLGCRYARAFPEEARAAIRLAVGLVGPVRLLDGCCGAWQRAAGAAAEADASRERLAAALGKGKHLLVSDPRCALELRELAPTTLVELASRHSERFRPVGAIGSFRYHDSCALGRGLGLYDEPRALLSRVVGTALELETPRELARCSGGGGILPVSMPDVAKAAGHRLAAEHERLGGGTLVTGCASSLSQLRRAGAHAVDLITLLESALSATANCQLPTAHAPQDG